MHTRIMTMKKLGHFSILVTLILCMVAGTVTGCTVKNETAPTKEIYRDAEILTEQLIHYVMEPDWLNGADNWTESNIFNFYSSLRKYRLSNAGHPYYELISLSEDERYCILTLSDVQKIASEFFGNDNWTAASFSGNLFDKYTEAYTIPIEAGIQTTPYTYENMHATHSDSFVYVECEIVNSKLYPFETRDYGTYKFTYEYITAEDGAYLRYISIEKTADGRDTQNGYLSEEELSALMKAQFPMAGGKLPVGYWLKSADATLTEYTVADLDGDGEGEIILHFSRGEGDFYENYGFMILRKEWGLKRGYVQYYQPLMDVRTDGTHIFTDGASNKGIGRITFETGYGLIEKIAYCADAGNGDMLYIIENAPVSKEAYDAYIAEQSDRQRATWYAISEDFPLTGDLSPDSDDPMINGFDIRTIGDYPEIEAAIRESIGKESGALTRRDFLSVMSLNLSGMGIQDITPVKALINLVEFWAHANEITDISPLSGLQNLYVLSLRDNDIVDISPIATLEKLATLDLDHNAGIDISPLFGLKSLVTVSIQHSELADISALRGLPVTDLNLSGNKISDISPLSTLPNIERLKLNDNPITDLTPLSGAYTLLGLYVVNCPIEDFSPVALVRHVEPYIEIAECTVEEIKAAINKLISQVDEYSSNRRYTAFTYNLAYLRGLYSGEPELISNEALDAWVNDYFLKQTAEEQETIPTLVQAIRALGFKKEAILSLNNTRRLLGSEMVLSDAEIDALYLTDDEEMKKALVNPLALYWQGETYTFAEIKAAGDALDISKDAWCAYYNKIVDYLKN